MRKIFFNSEWITNKFQLSVVYAAKNEKGEEEIGVLVVPNAEEFIEYAQNNNLEVTKELIDRIVNEEIRNLNKQFPVYKQIRSIKIQEREFKKTTTQKIKRYLINQEDSVH